MTKIEVASFTSHSLTFSVQISDKTMEESIQKEFSGEMQTALLTIGGYWLCWKRTCTISISSFIVVSCNFGIFFSASYISDPLTSHMTKLNKTIKDDVNTFSQIVIDRSEVRCVPRPTTSSHFMLSFCRAKTDQRQNSRLNPFISASAWQATTA